MSWLPLCFVLCPQSTPDQGLITITTRDGETLVSCQTAAADPHALLAELAGDCGREASGLDSIPHSQPIAVSFHERPLGWSLQTLAACAGWHAQLRSDRIEFSLEQLPLLEVAELESRMQASYLRALKAHPRHANSMHAEVALGAIQERRGNLQSALGHYRAAFERDMSAPMAPEALMRAGLVHARLGQQVQAIECYSNLLGHPHAQAYQASARLELTRAIAANGDGTQALFILNSLDKTAPAATDEERQTREYVRAISLFRAGMRAEALESLTKAEEFGVRPEWARAAHELRADVLAHFGRNADAALAWLAVANLSSGEEQARAWLRSAEQSLAAGDALGVLFIQRLAQDSISETAIAAIAEQARKSLGIDKAHTDGAAGDLLEVAQRAYDLGHNTQALALLEKIYPAREQRDPESRLDLVLLYARALGVEKQVDRAIEVLRVEALGVHDSAVLGRLCRTAGSLLETAGRHAEAFEAFGGKL